MVNLKIVHPLAILLLLASCQHKATYLTASHSAIYAPESGQVDTIRLHTDGREIQLAYAPDNVWYEFADSTFVLSVKENTLQRPWHDSLVFTSDTVRRVIPVYQHYVSRMLKARRHRLDFPQEGGEETVLVDTDAGDMVSVSAPEGFAAEYAEGKLVVSCMEQPGHMTHGWLVLSAGTMRDSIFLHQDGTVCPTCGGRGWVRCPDCKGAGYISVDGSTKHMKGCPTCGGSGDYFDWDHLTPGRGSIPCPDCQNP